MKAFPMPVVVACVFAACLTVTGCDGEDPGADKEKPPASVRETDHLSKVPIGTSGPSGGAAKAQEKAAGLRPTRPASAAAAELPTSPPATTQAGPPPPFRPLADAVEGEWVRYAALHERTIRYQIAKVTASTVTTRVTVHNHGKPLGAPATRTDPGNEDPLARQAARTGAVRHATTATIQAAGQTFPARLYEDRWIDEEVHYLRRVWVSPEVPVFGTIRMELYGDGALEARLELVGLGRSQTREGQPEKSPRTRRNQE